MTQTKLAVAGMPRQRQARRIVFICAALGAGMGFILSFHPIGMDAFEFHDVARISEDEQGRTHVELVGSASIWVFGVKVFSQERVFSQESTDWDLSDRWRHYCQLIAAALTVVGLMVGAGLGLCVQRLIQWRAPGCVGIQIPQKANCVSAQSPSV